LYGVGVLKGCGCHYRAAVTVLVLAVHHMVGGGVLPPDELVEQVVEARDEAKLSQHLVHLWTVERVLSAV